ncbi:uncharacterized protein M421DRAFT_98012 [Didymella exigua CBS 183.55]|uniref:Asteroid domain-containing protein n=1 Tax=Didymella exigua CBS 183.55 TaxID=1150837 RepID=A0A6A5RZ38_9PLEO|nr:uncharacterized protein M421DRAFT_98012 [Didymella exigua CBS 183.55]KAF1932789.1 hypothetical protein M421DRAFT_98012 [Didymella exigua CBS 183.55]
MGIPGLARRSEPYAECRSAQQLGGYQAIVDGPSLAYHAHKLALAGLPRVPSYADVNTEAIRWLNTLEAANIKVTKIVFDGALPSSKRSERVHRLEQNNNRVRNYRVQYPISSCPVPTYLGSILHAFLAPSLREALLDTPFAARTRIEPGEADDWCALHAKDHARSIIFTSDTDLLLYGYPAETLIVFFQDADVTTGFKSYCPEQMRQRMQLQHLAQFAFAMTREPSHTSDDLLRDAKDLDLSSDAYLEFSGRYAGRTAVPSHVSKVDGLPIPLQKLDVRISEFIHQVLDSSPGPLVYLPLLVEDPNQSSAWSSGQDYRELAYSILAPKTSTVHEYRRKAQGISVQELPMRAPDVSATDMMAHISGVSKWASDRNLSRALMWPLFALSIVLLDSKTTPSVSVVLRVLNGDFDNSWEFIHLTARLQAVLYSLRILQQVVTVQHAIQGKTSAEDATLQMAKELSDLPSIADTFTVPGQTRKILVQHEKLKSMVEEIYKASGVSIPTDHVSNKKKKKHSKEAERKKKKQEQRQQARPQTSNVFAMLDG